MADKAPQGGVAPTVVGSPGDEALPGDEADYEAQQQTWQEAVAAEAAVPNKFTRHKNAIDAIKEDIHTKALGMLTEEIREVPQSDAGLLVSEVQEARFSEDVRHLKLLLKSDVVHLIDVLREWDNEDVCGTPQGMPRPAV